MRRNIIREDSEAYSLYTLLWGYYPFGNADGDENEEPDLIPLEELVKLPGNEGNSPEIEDNSEAGGYVFHEHKPPFLTSQEPAKLPGNKEDWPETEVSEDLS